MINVLGYVLMGFDKSRAKKNERRISERTFFIIAILFGAVGIYLGMNKFRHKTLHKNFTMGIPIILIIQAIMIGVIYYFLNIA